LRYKNIFLAINFIQDSSDGLGAAGSDSVCRDEGSMSNTQQRDTMTEQDELEKIMNEIEELQQEMETTSAETKAPPMNAPAKTPSAAAPAPIEGSGPSVSEAAETNLASSDSNVPTMSQEEEDILKEIQASAQIDDSNMEESLAELKAEETRSTLLDDVISHEEAPDASYETTSETVTELTSEILAEVSPEASNDTIDEQENFMSQSESHSDGSLTLTLTGNMTLKLKYEYEGQEVMVSFADQALRVQMTDGTEFKIPVARLAPVSNVKRLKKSA
jgi:hypothetical protein